LVLYDSQYTPEEYAGLDGNISHVGWGHSTWEMGLRECRAAEAKHLLLHHHDPMHDDNMVASIEAKAQAAAKGTGIEVQAAEQFREIEI
jgi:ribonuclease BN (tRNA processing enzyme)